MSDDLRITKCEAMTTHVIVYFSQDLDYVAVNPPESPQNYLIHQLEVSPTSQATHVTMLLGTGVTVARTYYDVVNRATVLQMGSVQADGQWLRIMVRNVAAAGKRIEAPQVFVVQVGAAEKPDVPAVKKAKPKLDDNAALIPKILQPQYAIGMQIISQDQYNSLKNEYFAQSELSLGLILPLILVVLGLKLIPQVGLTGWAWGLMCVAMALISGALFVIGAERFHKFRTEVKLLILGNWEQQQQKAKQSTGDSNGNGASAKAIKTAVAKLINEAAKQPKQPPAGKVDVNIKL